MATFGVLPMVKSANLQMVLHVGTIFTNGNQKNPERFSAANGTIGTDGTIGRSHGGIFIILINTPHLFVFLIYLFVCLSSILCYL